MVNIGESTTGTVTLADNTTTTVTVPSGEVWKFDYLSATDASSGNPGDMSNSGILVGATDGTDDVSVARTNNNHPPIGGDNVAAEGASSLIIDGNLADLHIANDSGGERVVHWNAHRISDDVVSGIGTLSGGGETTINIGSSMYRLTTIGFGGSKLTFNDELEVGYDNGTNKFVTAETSAGNTPPVGSIGGTDADGDGDYFATGPSVMTLDGSQRDLYLNHIGSNTKEYYYVGLQV